MKFLADCQLTCASSTVSRLGSNGATSGALTVPHAFYLLAGPSAAVAEFTAGKMYLVRVGS